MLSAEPWFVPSLPQTPAFSAEVQDVPAPRGKKQARRLDPELRRQLVSAPIGVHKASGVHVRGRARNREILLSRYFATTAELFKKVKVLHVMFDETRLGNDATVNFCIWDPEGQVASWAPPQAPVKELCVFVCTSGK